MYQEIEAAAEARGLEKGRQKEAALMILRQLGRRFGEIPRSLTEPIGALSVERLENLGEALLDFQGLSDLVSWLEH